MKEYYFKPTTNTGVNAFFDSSLISRGLEDKKDVEKMRSQRYHHNSRVEKNLIGTDLYINDQMNKFIDYSSLALDSKLIHKRDKLENDNELRDRGKDRKHKVKDRSKDKNKIKSRNKDHKYEFKDMNNHKSELKDLKYESKDRSKHPKDELKDKSKYELKHAEYKYGFKNDCTDLNSKIKRSYGDHKCLLKNNHSMTKSSTKDNDSKMRKNSSKNDRRELKYRSEIVSATDDCYPEKERKHKSKSSERRKNSKKTIIVEKPGRPLELAIVKGERISEKERKRNKNSEKRSKSRSSKRIKKIDETSTRRKKSPFIDNSKILTHMHVVKEPRDNSRKKNNTNTEQTGESMLTEAFYKQNRKFKSCRQSRSGYTDVTDIDIDKAGIKTKNGKDKVDVENEKKDLINYGNECKENNNFVKKSFNKVTVQDIYKMDNMMEYEMDMKKRLLKKMESNRKRTQISMIGNSLSNYDQGNDRKDNSLPEKLPIYGTIKTSNLSDFETKYKKIRQKRKKYRSVSDLKTIYDNGDRSVLSKPSTKILICSNFDKNYDKNIFDSECSKKSQLLVEEKNEKNNLYGTGILNTNTSKSFNREKKRVSFATKCGLSQNSSDDSGEKLVPLKNLKKTMHNLSNIKMNKVGLNKKRNMFNKKSWQYSSKLLKLFRNKSILFGNDRNLYQCIKKKPRIGENFDTRIKNDLPWSFRNKINLFNILLKESSKSIEDEVCKEELELKETNTAPIAKQVSAPSTADNNNMGINMALKNFNINSNHLFQNNISKMNSAFFIDKEKIHEKANIMSQNSNQVNYDSQNIFHFPHKDNNLKCINDNTMIGPNYRNNLFPKSNLGYDENLSYFKFHQDHTTGGSFPDWHNEVKTGSAFGNIKMELPEKDTNYYSQSFFKPERPFLKKMRNSDTNNNYFRRNRDARRCYGEKDYGLNLTNNAKNNQLLRQKRLWNNKSFGKIVNGSAYDPIHSRNMRHSDFKSRLNNDYSDQMSYESRKEVSNSMKTLNSFLSEVKLNNCNDENSNSSKVIIKDSHKSMLEIKFSDKFSINVNGNEIKVEKFGNNDELKGQLTIVNNNFKKDNEVKTCSDTKLCTSVEKGIITENQINSNPKLNQNSTIIEMCKTFADKSSWTEFSVHDDLFHVPPKVRGNNSHHLIVDKNGSKTKGCSNSEPSTNCMVDLGTDCLPIPTSMENIESDRAKHADRMPYYSSSNHPKNLETSNTPPNRNDTFLNYNVPESKFKTECKNLLKTMENINNKDELNTFKQDVGTQYDTMGIACSVKQFQKQTCKIEKSNILHENEGIKYNKPTFRMGDENTSSTINIRGNINNNNDENLGIINTEVKNTFGLKTIQIGLPEEEICKRIVLNNIRKCVDISAPNAPDKCKNSMKNESCDRNMFTYLVKKIKTLINIVSGKFKLESKLDQQSKSKKTSNPTKIKSCISFPYTFCSKKQKYRVNFDCVNCNNCKVNSKEKMHNSENKLIVKENFEKNISVEEELQLDPTTNFKDIIIDAVEKFLISNLEFLPTNVEPFQILINNDQTNFNNSNQLQNLNNFRNHINPTNLNNKCRNNICLVSNKRIQHKNNLAPGTTMIKRFFGKDKRKMFNGLRNISVQGSTT